MSKVLVSVGMSLDGFIAGPNGGPTNLPHVSVDVVEALHSPAVTHLRYAVGSR